MGVIVDLKEHIEDRINSSSEVSLVQKTFSPEVVSRMALEEYSFVYGQYIIAAINKSESIEYLQSIFDQINFQIEPYSKSEFKDRNETIYSGNLLFKQRVGEFDPEVGLIPLSNEFASFLPKPLNSEENKSYFGSLYNIVDVIMFPSENIARGVLERKIPKPWFSADYVSPGDKFIPSIVPIKKEFIRNF